MEYLKKGTAISYRDCNRLINRSKFSRGRDFKIAVPFFKLDEADS